MFVAANQTHFSLAIDGLALDLQILSFSGCEATSQPFAFDLKLAGGRPMPNLESLSHRPTSLTLGPVSNGIHGPVRSVEQGDSGKHLTRYRTAFVPQLTYLAQRTNQRILQHLTVPQIVALTLEKHGVLADAYRFQLGTRYPEREYCMQYNESDLQFVQRLCYEEGIYFHFQHSATAHLLVFDDDQTMSPRLASVAYQQDSGLVTDRLTVRYSDVRLEARTSRTTRRDYGLEKSRLTLESIARGEARSDLEDYDYPDRFADREHGEYPARRALERQRSGCRPVESRSDQSLLFSGHFLLLATHPQVGWNDLWLLTGMIHERRQPQVLEESVISDTSASPNDSRQGYCNRFQATPWEALFRSPPTPSKPHILDTQSAVVTDPKDGKIHYDRYGRVKVQLHWNREGQADDGSSRWLRVASGQVGRDYGAIVIPRVGMEVLVTFFESNPDQPLVTSYLFHREHLVPYELPARKTHSVFRNPSSPGDGGYNELRIEDRKDQGQIFVHAQRNWDENIEHDQKIRISHQRHDIVETDSYSEFRAEEHYTIHARRRAGVRVSDRLTVANDQHLKVTSGQFVEAGQEIHPSGGLRVVLETGAELILKGDGSFLKFDTSGVTLSGASVRVNSGGSLGSGSGAAPLLPGSPLDADAVTVGQVLDDPVRGRSGRKGLEQLIVDVWGGPTQGNWVVLSPPESEA